MALSDPQTVTIDSTPYTCNRVETEKTRSVYQTSDENLKLTVSHQETKTRTRRMVRLDQRVIAEDPLTAVNEYKGLGIYLVIDEPEFGFDDTDIANVVAGLQALCDSTFIGKVCGAQH